MKYISKIYLIMILAIMLVGCDKKENLNIDLSDSKLDTHAESELDRWLKTEFLDPYNMAIIYRFDRHYTTLDKEISPVKEDKVKLVAEGLKVIFIEPYIAIAGKDFFKPIAPKQFALFGSGEYQDGSIILGTADATRQINLYALNDFDKANPGAFIKLFHTIHHEFAHVLHQNIPVPPAYEAISNKYVGNNWNSWANTDVMAKSMGFITRYSRMNKDEDFVEMISTLLVEGQDYFDAYVNSAPPAAIEMLRGKERMVVDFYSSNFNIDFRALQIRVRKAIDLYGPASIRTLAQNLQAGSYRGFTVSKDAVGQSPQFSNAFNRSITAMPAIFGEVNPVFELDFQNLEVGSDNMVLKLSCGFNFWYNLRLTIIGDRVRFTKIAQGTGVSYDNGSLFLPYVDPLVGYLTGRTFEISWIEDVVPRSKNQILGFVDVSNRQLAFYGRIKR